ncbi:conserved hypothetical protein [Leishmania infantum JPCM5]|uniref:Uncharacterized protein n=2 Tax=Leishmania infantum TaxID=5671 RepID=A4HZT2_LEIIN|nr:conserved hypothetical protein [Leishmania infantum JPCM5]CAC9487782.1 hypothetical_protein_-_conserved [Leishmania infantum]CAM67996.1 conserved hypothetical protein [Leishmania infantum JPCM5]SUZ41749.1 hypothetical_protein_-_conserved [Leishmania infantum]|eukprot:XP_001465573.1 conserved hypothetical protein [Leishmania infantum JPCM5]
MPSIQVSGRHGSYATQFWKPSAWAVAASRFRNRADMRAAYSRKAIDRRLVLPLDSHNWIRALEVLNAGYARLGRTPEHFKMVLRDMVEHRGPYAERATFPSSAFAPPCPTQSRGGVDGAEARVFGGDGQRLPSTLAEMPAGSEGAADILPAVDALRDRAYAGEIPSNRSLWVTLVWSYCALDQPSGALDTFHLATRRFRFSSATMQHMASLLLPVLCRHAQLEEATRLYETYLKVDGTKEDADGALASRHHRSRIEDADARRWLAEAAARRGDWKRVQNFAGDARAPAGSAPAADDHPHATTRGSPSRRTIGSLFHDTASPKTPALSPGGAHLFASSEGAGRTEGQQATPRSSAAPPARPMLQALSREAVRQLFRCLCRGGSESGSHSQLRDALCCWEHLYGPVLEAASAVDGDAMASCRDDNPCRLTRPPPLEDVHELLNLLASHRRWKESLSVFCHLFLSRPAKVYVSATLADLQVLPSSIGSSDGPLSASANGEKPITAPVLRLDATTLNILFSSLPAAAAPLLVRARKSTPTSATTTAEERAHKQWPSQSHAASDERELRLSASAVPVTVVRLFDDLLLLRDDMVLTDFVMAAVGPALLQVGQAERVFDLLARTPMMVAASQRKAPAYVSTEHQALKAELVALGYAAFALCSSSARRHDMVRLLPHLFPPEVVRRVATEGEGNTPSSCAIFEGRAVLRNYSRSATASSTGATMKSDDTVAPNGSVDSLQSHTRANTASTTAPSLLDMKWHAPTAASAFRGGDLNVPTRPGRRSSAATLTSLADDAMRRDYVRLHERRRDAFTGSHADAERDPRPIPKGLHDHASGWDFFGRGGEMVFANHKRTPHPFTMQPKVMRDLRNPYRGWNPRRNSSLAHKENVIKWNGKSAV